MEGDALVEDLVRWSVVDDSNECHDLYLMLAEADYSN